MEKDVVHSYNGILCVLRVKSLQSCSTLCNPMDCSLPGSSVQGIFQARILEWLAMPSSRGIFPSRDCTHISYISCTTSTTWEMLKYIFICIYTHTHMYMCVCVFLSLHFLLQILFPYRLLQNTECSSLCFTVVGPFWLSIFYIVVFLN